QPDNPTLLHRVPSGNLLLANGRLLVTDARTLYAFVPADQLPEEDDQAAAGPRDALRQAQAALARGGTGRALDPLAGRPTGRGAAGRARGGTWGTSAAAPCSTAPGGPSPPGRRTAPTSTSSAGRTSPARAARWTG